MATQLEGVRELSAQIADLGAKFATKTFKATAKAALQEAEHVARARMPQGTEIHKTYKGRLVSPPYAITTLHIEVKADLQRDIVRASLGVGREAFYAVQFVELGTSKKAAQPWLRPAFEQSEDAMLRTVGDEMRRRIAAVAKRKK